MKSIRIILLFISFYPISLQAQTAVTPSGTGTSSDPYLIANLSNLYWVSQNSSSWVSGKYFKQTANIDASATSSWFTDGAGGYYGFPPIGGEDAVGNEVAGTFNGTYDGNKFTISNLYIKRLNDKIGLFGRIGTATIKNLKIKDAYVESRSGAEPYGIAILAGNSTNLTISKVYIDGGSLVSNGASGAVGAMIGWSNTLSATSSGASATIDMNSSGFVGVGGFIGITLATANISHCFSTGSVSSTVGRVGGFIGDASNSSNLTIDNSFASGKVESTTSIVGGFIGMLYKPMRYTNCYASGDVKGSSSVGGFFGWTWNSSSVADTKFVNCYASGNVTASSTYGGFGSTTQGYSAITFTDTYWNPETTGYSTGLATSTPSGLASLTTAQMKVASNFSNWDFNTSTADGTDDDWKYESGQNSDFPMLTNLYINFSFNLAPTNIALSSTSIYENKASGSLVGTYSTTDFDSGDTHTYSLVSGTGDTNNSSFTISGTQLLTNAVFDYETKTTYSIRVKTTDSSSATYSKSFTITIKDIDEDDDGDGVANTIDNCPNTANADQLDTDGDGTGDACDADDDDDGWLDTVEIACGSDPLDASNKPLDTDGDGIANCQDPDMDNDGCLNAEDALPLDATECSDNDNDGFGDNSDLDDDNDGQSDADEISCGSNPLDASSMSPDFDEDGILDCIDSDDDNDGCLDYADAFPFNASECVDTDLDGIGNNADTDDDNDGWSDVVELSCGTNPLIVVSQPSDLDNDGIADCEDPDIDGDGANNEVDMFPNNPNEWIDTDGDGAGDNLDVDDDNDGVLDSQDAFPKDASEWLDADGDGIGDNADLDDNNDGYSDEGILVSGFVAPISSGLESTWKVINIDKYPNSRVIIYNKNGQEVFNQLGYKNDWKATYKDTDKMLPAGSYYYRIKLDYENSHLDGWIFISY